MDKPQDVFVVMADLRAGNRGFVIATITEVTASSPREVGARMVVTEDGLSAGTIGGGPFEAAVIDESRKLLAEGGGLKKVSYDLDSFEGMRCGGVVEVLLDPVPARHRLVIVGAGHVGTRLGRLAAEIEMPHIVLDDRPEYARPERFPSAQGVHCVPLDRDPFASVPMSKLDCVVMVTRRNDLDTACLGAALRTPACYIGMIGSKRRAVLTFRDLEKQGLDPRNDPRVHAPVGLKLGDRSPGEVALSILAEVVQVKSGCGEASPSMALGKKEPVEGKGQVASP